MIRNTCPEHLCTDLSLSEVELSCSGEREALLSATARGVGTQDNIRSFLESISERPLTLRVNGTTVQVEYSAVQQQGSDHDRVSEIAGSTVAAVVALVVLLLALSYTLWRRYICDNNSGSTFTRNFHG